MAAINLPSWFDVLECEVTLQPEVRGFSGPFGGPTEVQDLLGDRWRLRLTLPDGDFRWGGRTGALFNQLRGGVNWLRLHDLARPVPRGTARGSIVLASSAAQGSSALALSGVVGRNLMLGGGFEIDSNADGLADGWASYSAGSVSGVTHGRPTGNGSVWAQRAAAVALGSTSSDRVGLGKDFTPVTAGLAYTLAADVVANYGTVAMCMAVAWYTSGALFISADSTSQAGPLVWSRLSVTATAPAGATQAYCYIWIEGAGTALANPGFLADNVQLELGTTVSAFEPGGTLLAGDKLGHNGEQLLEVADDVAANDAGVVTVPLTNRLRKAIASGQAIVWDKPSLPFQLLDTSGVPTAYTRGRARGQQVEFVEAWQA